MNFSLLWLIPLFLAGFTLVHLSKMMRLYLILLESKIEFKRFVLTYLKTTLTNLIIPFKLGEIFRIYCFSRETKVFQIGLFGVLVDRFFDTVTLLVILIPFELFVTGKLTLVTGILTAFAILAVFLFIVFPGIYGYLNKYIIINKTSKRSMTALRGLEIAKTWYQHVRDLVRGRYALIVLLSCAAWIVEIGVLWCLAQMRGMLFTATAFSDYIATIFMSGRSRLLVEYTMIGATIIAFVIIVGYIIYYTRRYIQRKAGEQR